MPASTAPTPTTHSPTPTTPNLATLAVHLPSTAGLAPQSSTKVHHLTTRARRHLIIPDLPLLPSTKILHPRHHQVPMTTPSALASPSADAAAVSITEATTAIMVDHTDTNAAAAGADVAVEAGEDAEDAVVVNAASTPGPEPALATST